METRKIGNTAPRETPDSRRREVAEKKSCTFRYAGEYEALLARLPAKKGAKWEGGWKVVSATLERGRGGMGVLTVACSKGGASGSGSGGASELDHWVEIEMAQEEVDVRTLCESAYTGDIARWEAGEANLKAQYRFINANCGEAMLPDSPGADCAEDGQLSALAVARLILAGHESVLRFHPVVTRTTTYDGRPSVAAGADLGRVGAGVPPEAPGGWEYLKTGDHLTQDASGDWTRTEQWTGAKKWSKSLYKGGSGIP